MALNLAEQSAALKSRQSELETRLEKLKRDASQEHSSDAAEQAQERENDEVVDAIGLETREALISVKAALQRIEDGSYGECTDCGEEIAAERLQARPEASRCIRCAD